MSLSRREVILASATTAVVVGLVSWVVAAPLIKNIQKAHAERTKLQNEKNVLEKLIAQRGSLLQRIETLRAQLPRFKPDEMVSAQIISSVKRIADGQQLSISRMDPDQEKPIGDLSEIAIECAWEGGLTNIIAFLHAVQSQGAMLDIRQLNVQPAQNTTQSGRLRGNFKMFYAFMREKPGAAKAAATTTPATAAGATPVEAAVPGAPVMQIASNATATAPKESSVAPAKPPLTTMPANAPPTAFLQQAAPPPAPAASPQNAPAADTQPASAPVVELKPAGTVAVGTNKSAADGAPQGIPVRRPAPTLPPIPNLPGK